MHVMKKIVLHALDAENCKEKDRGGEGQKEKKSAKVVPQGSQRGSVRRTGRANRVPQETTASSQPLSVQGPDIESPLPSRPENVHNVVATPPALSRVGPKGNTHSERGNLSRHSSGFGSLQDEESSARLDWNETRMHYSSTTISPAHEMKSIGKNKARKSPSKRPFEDDSREYLQSTGGDGRVSPVHAWGSSPLEPVTSPAVSR